PDEARPHWAITEIRHVFSVDLVAHPAAGGTFDATREQIDEEIEMLPEATTAEIVTDDPASAPGLPAHPVVEPPGASAPQMGGAAISASPCPPAFGRPSGSPAPGGAAERSPVLTEASEILSRLL